MEIPQSLNQTVRGREIKEGIGGALSILIWGMLIRHLISRRWNAQGTNGGLIGRGMREILRGKQELNSDQAGYEAGGFFPSQSDQLLPSLVEGGVPGAFLTLTGGRACLEHF